MRVHLLADVRRETLLSVPESGQRGMRSEAASRLTGAYLGWFRSVVTQLGVVCQRPWLKDDD